MGVRLLLVGSSLLLSSVATATAPTAPVVLGQSYELRSDVLDQTRRINVYFPFGYEESERRYPVLYLLDGGVAEDFFHIAGIASLAAEFRNIEPFLVVGIEGIDRYHDLTHPTSVESDLEYMPTGGGSADFRRFIADELIPWIDASFRVTSERVLIGESAAGLFVVETLLRAPQLFAGYVAISPSLWWDAQSLARSAEETFTGEGFPAGRRVYLSIASEGGEMREGVDLVARALEHASAKMEWTFRPMEHESHGTIFHPAALDAVRWMFPLADPDIDEHEESSVSDYEVRWTADTGG